MSTNYTISSGDNLWKIVKNQYGNQLSSNAEIQTVVDTIAEENNISNPSLIFAGDTIKLPSYDSIFETKAASPVSSASFEDFYNWTLDSYEKYENGGRNKIESYDFVDDEIETDDDEFEKTWTEGIEALASGNIEEYDENGNGKLDFNEYVTQKMTEYNEMFPDDTYEFDSKTGDVTAYKYDTAKGEYVESDYMNEYMESNFATLDIDGSGTLERDEIEAYYAALDSMDSSGSSYDGKIKFGAVVNTSLTSATFTDRLASAAKVFGADE